MKLILSLWIASVALFSFQSCSSPNEDKKKNPIVVARDSIKADTVHVVVDTLPVRGINDSLNEMAAVIGASIDSGYYFSHITASKEYQNYKQQFSKRWVSFDTSRLRILQQFCKQEIEKEVKPNNTLFYPFSGPDILYATTFFPKAKKYILVGLEPVGTLSTFRELDLDSIGNYFNSLNSSINALLKFSFFRTNSMEKDLKRKELDGVIHLIFLFLNRTGNSLVSAKAIGIDSLGNKFNYTSFEDMKQLKPKTAGLEIVFLSPNKEEKILEYYSVNLSNSALERNKGFMAYFKQLENCVTYLKGASYLLHKPYFSTIRNYILNRSTGVVQDDSGVPLKYFEASKRTWIYMLYGNYSVPISLFKNSFQTDLDSLYYLQGSKNLGFGIGYNFKDKNSNLMIALPL